MKKVIGGKNILLLALLIISPLISFSQGLTEHELNKLLNYRSLIGEAISKGNETLSHFYLREMYDYSNSFTEIEKKKEAGAIYCFEYLVESVNRTSKTFDRETILKDIEVSENCLYGYNETYRGDLSKKIKARIDLVIIWSLISHYQNINNYQRAFEYLEVFASETMNLNPDNWEISKINSAYGDIYKSLGRYKIAISYYNKSYQTLKEIEDPSKYDTLSIIYCITDIMNIRIQQNMDKEALLVFDELSKYVKESYYSSSQNAHAYLNPLELLTHIYTKYAFFDKANSVLEDMKEIIQKGAINKLNCFHCIQLVQGSQIYISVGTNDWESVYDIIKSDSNLFSIHYGAFLKASLAVGNFSEAISTIKYINNDLKIKFEGLSNIDPATRAKKIQSWVSSGNFKSPLYTVNSLENREYAQYFLEYILKYKSIEIDLNSSYNRTINLLGRKTIKDSIVKNLEERDIAIEIVKSSNVTERKQFIGVQSGIEMSELKNGRLFVSKIQPKSSAFFSGLRVGDVIASFDGKDINVKNSKNISKIINAGVIGCIKKIGVQRDSKDSVLIYYYKIDSVFDYKDSIEYKYAIFTIGNKSNAQYDYQLFDTKNIDRVLNQSVTKENEIALPDELKDLFHNLNDKKRIYLSIDGMFNKINPEMLIVKDSTGAEKYLGDLFEIHLVNSSRELLTKGTTSYTKDIVAFGYPNYTLTENEQQQIAKNMKADSTLLAFNRGGDAVTGNYKFDPRPATKFEVEGISEMLSKMGWQTTVYTGANALEENIKQVKSPRILHIATHGFFAEDIKPEEQQRFMGIDSRTVIENPLLRSGLALAGAERSRTDTSSERLSNLEDGILTAEEVQYLNLDSTELVVLSACETGLGEIVNGEGVYGLQRAFRAAGAKSVLMSLWKVDDFATMELMKSFYKHWLEDGMTKHDALWQAKLDLRNDPAHPEWAKPYYWGAFVLIGE